MCVNCSQRFHIENLRWTGAVAFMQSSSQRWTKRACRAVSDSASGEGCSSRRRAQTAKAGEHRSAHHFVELPADDDVKRRRSKHWAASRLPECRDSVLLASLSIFGCYPSLGEQGPFLSKFGSTGCNGLFQVVVVHIFVPCSAACFGMLG